MWKILALLTLRKLFIEKAFVIVSILSLSVGLSSFLVLSLYLQSELTYDESHLNHNDIYRVVSRFPTTETALTSDGLGPFLIEENPQLGTYVRFRKSNQNTLRNGENNFAWDNVYAVDQQVFSIFSHNVVHGNLENVFSDAYSVAISESVAKSYFGDENPIGEVLSTREIDYKVSLVFEDLPENTHLKYEVLLPYEIFGILNPRLNQQSYINTLWRPVAYTYIMPAETFDPSTFPEISDRFYEKYMSETGERVNSSYSAELQPLTSIHFGEKFPNDLDTGNQLYVYAMEAIATFVLLVAVINFLNLLVARISRRTREIGQFKVIGASTTQLLAQYFLEVLAITFLSLLAGVAIAEAFLTLTPISAFLGKGALELDISDPVLWFNITMLGFVLSFLAGIYPGIYLAHIPPQLALRRTVKSWKSGITFRQILLFLQLFISMVVISSSLLMTEQLEYIGNKQLGFDGQNRVVVQLKGADIVEKFSALKEELEAQNGIVSVVSTNVIPGSGASNIRVIAANEQGEAMSELVSQVSIEPEFISSMGMEIVRGRGFSVGAQPDRDSSVVINESFSSLMNWDKPIGKRISLGNEEKSVIGVVADFHFRSLHNEIGPLILTPFEDNFLPSPILRALITRYIVIDIGESSVDSSQHSIETVLRQFDQDFIFEPVFLETILNRQYESEMSLGQLTKIFAGICLLVSAIGLFGLTAYTVELRLKEIGIRRVIGASTLQIIVLFIRPFLPLIFLAAIPSSVIAYYVLGEWLERFAYRAELNYYYIFLSLFLVALVTISTIVLRSAGASIANPVQNIRYE